MEIHNKSLCTFQQRVPTVWNQYIGDGNLEDGAPVH